jgi:hypothetical protein
MTKLYVKQCPACNKVTTHRVGRKKKRQIDYCMVCGSGKR